MPISRRGVEINGTPEMVPGAEIASTGTTVRNFSRTTIVVAAAAIAIGNPVLNGVANAVLFEDSSQNLAASSTWTYDPNSQISFLTGTSAEYATQRIVSFNNVTDGSFNAIMISSGATIVDRFGTGYQVSLGYNTGNEFQAGGFSIQCDGTGLTNTRAAIVAALAGVKFNHTDFNSNGDVELQVVGGGIAVKEGSNARQGVTALVGGTKVVNNTVVTANSRIFLTSQADGGTPGFLRVSARTAGTSFTITSSNGADTSTVAYEIFEPS